MKSGDNNNPRLGNTSNKGRGKSGAQSAASSKRKVSSREAALQVLAAVEQEGAYSNLLLNQVLKQANLTPADTGLATELVYGTIARQKTLDYYLESYVAKGLAKLQPWVRSLLRLSLYQILYLDRVPDHAAVSEAVNIAKRKGHQGISGMVNGVLRNILRNRDKLTIPEDLPAAERIALMHSHPEWLVQRWIEQYGEQEAEAMCRANNEAPPVSVRVNTTMISRNKLIQEMQEEGLVVEPSLLSDDGIIVKSGGNMALTDWYKEGMLSVQDESSMLVAGAVDPKPGMTVLDCCAAPGGKTSHMGEKMEDQGRIIANDIHPHKVELIHRQAERLGLASIETVCHDALDLASNYKEASFDRILLDAPCSGFGVIRRKPDLRWTKSPEDVEAISALQYELLSRVSKLLKPGGTLVYSTCTTEHAENGGVVERFLKENDQFAPAGHLSLREELRHSAILDEYGIQILPHQFHSDGFYIARLTRVETS
ncbi:ribosomal RNA small subunit methyltransferase B [Paenibacillus sp. TCA20]|uniref:16S rRNA (cytosine(967)-C(5))-methyltransferase RsmB n=1 Tax=Paenibacillus TaxID=44249 RepID=UPI0004D4F662|nr:16S rRNA (cytosine(967)-C(5))-methyltransferase RsmB [Paenibacillus sp. TCA20]GAK39802.1 ribosomal RNA small subunit methyltransferase B [Paenibacillus sp. TCA20]